jgi:hypothetical protein
MDEETEEQISNLLKVTQPPRVESVSKPRLTLNSYSKGKTEAQIMCSFPMGSCRDSKA